MLSLRRGAVAVEMDGVDDQVDHKENPMIPSVAIPVAVESTGEGGEELPNNRAQSSRRRARLPRSLASITLPLVGLRIVAAQIQRTGIVGDIPEGSPAGEGTPRGDPEYHAEDIDDQGGPTVPYPRGTGHADEEVADTDEVVDAAEDVVAEGAEDVGQLGYGEGHQRQDHHAQENLHQPHDEEEVWDADDVRRVLRRVGGLHRGGKRYVRRGRL